MVNFIKKNKEILSKICIFIVLIAVFIGGIKCGNFRERQRQEEIRRVMVRNFTNTIVACEHEINTLEDELEIERQIEHIEVEYVPASDVKIDFDALNNFERDAIMIAQTIFGEANGCGLTQKAAVAWTILNRYSSGRYGNSIAAVITAPSQFFGYSPDNPVTEENYNIARDVLVRWYFEQNWAIGSVGRILPEEYTSFSGDGKLNHFYGNHSNTEWNWSWGTVYES